MRFIFFLILLAGLALGIGVPFYANNFSGHALGSWRVYDQGGMFESFEVTLDSSDAPLNIIVDLTAIGAPTFAEDRTVVTLTVAHNGRTVLADTLNFVNARPRENSPQSPDRIFRSFAGPLAAVEKGTYSFNFGFGDAERIDTRAVDVTLRTGAEIFDPRLQPIGYALIVVGVIGIVLASRRRRGGDSGGNPNSQPPPPRWGRDAGGPR
jgi:hypothetical protein